MQEVYFTLSFSSDKDPHKILEQVAGGWGKSGGKKLYLKEIASFNTKLVVKIFHLQNNNTEESILEEFKMVREEAKEIKEQEDAEGSMRYILRDLPTLNIRKLIPRIPGQVTKIFQGWTGRQHEMRKCLRLGADKEEVEMIHYLVETAQSRRIFEQYWDPKVKVMAILDNKEKRKGSHQT